ncbi:MAG: hypothetical protein IPJ83_11185 [Saprospiraceae bacterium]|nr:hypothetical protein [Candidatus Vicinibacter proximus]
MAEIRKYFYKYDYPKFSSFARTDISGKRTTFCKNREYSFSDIQFNLFLYINKTKKLTYEFN